MTPLAGWGRATWPSRATAGCCGPPTGSSTRLAAGTDSPAPRSRSRPVRALEASAASAGLRRARRLSAADEARDLFSERGLRSHGGGRMLLRRPAGAYELHSVREYQDGESLRRVHWPSTARRQQLMVKELEDAPRDEVVVVLDAQAGFGARRPTRASTPRFEIAGSILWTHARRGRNARLLVTSVGRRGRLRSAAYERDWGRAMEALAAAEQDGRRPARRVSRRHGRRRRAGERCRRRHARASAGSRRGADRAGREPPAGLGRLRRPPELRRPRAARCRRRCCGSAARGRGRPCRGHPPRRRPLRGSDRGDGTDRAWLGRRSCPYFRPR